MSEPIPLQPAPLFRCKALALLALGWALIASTSAALAGNQQYEPMADSVRSALHAAVSDAAAPRLLITDPIQRRHWLETMSQQLASRIPDTRYRKELLTTIHYEATRAGLDPQMVLGVIQVESAFRKYAVSSAGARGYMQVMPFWIKVIGSPSDNLFHMRTNLRYGCTILRHYLDIEKGDLFRALGRYNGSLNQAAYPNLVRGAWNKWQYQPPQQLAADSDNEAASVDMTVVTVSN